jgi:hypothetical protein
MISFEISFSGIGDEMTSWLEMGYWSDWRMTG